MNRSKILQMFILLAFVVLIAGGILRILRHNSMSLTEYEKSIDSQETSSDRESGSDPTPEPSAAENTSDGGASPGNTASSDNTDGGQASDVDGRPADHPLSSLTGAPLNGDSQTDSRVTIAEGFYHEPLSDRLQRYITGISYPARNQYSSSQPEIAMDELRYVHVLHYDFEGQPAEGELICNEYIADDLTEIFYTLYSNEYRLEKVLLIDEYNADDTASMADNNTSCFNYRQIENQSSLSMHAYGLAVDVNPLYNPYITYTEDGTEQISPEEGAPYADRSLSFPYKIDDNDLCYKLFIQHGFTWGGNWNHSKDYQHFQKTK